MNDWVHKMISTRSRASSGVCSDENTIASYLEGNLSDQEKLEFETHVSGCAVCRDVLALVMKLREAEPTASAPEKDAFQISGNPWFHFSLPVPVLGAVCIAIISIAGIFFLMRDSGENLHPTQSAQLHLPTRQNRKMEPNVPPVSSAGKTVGAQFEKIPMAVPEAGIDAQGTPVPDLKKDDMPSAAPPSHDAAMPMETPASPGRESARSPENESALDAPDSRMKSRQADGMPQYLQTAKTEGTSIRDVEEPEAIGLRKIGDKEFYWDSGYWTDRQCPKNPGVRVVEVAPADPEYKSILEHYPDLIKLAPAKIFVEGRIYIFR